MAVAQQLLRTKDRSSHIAVKIKNGVLRLNDRTLLPFDAGWKLRRTLAVRYEPDARCPKFMEVLLNPQHYPVTTLTSSSDARRLGEAQWRRFQITAQLPAAKICR